MSSRSPRLSHDELLETLRIVHAEGSLTRAGQKMYLASPAILYRLRLLEKRTGKAVYVRGERRRATLTAHGLALLSK